MHIQVLSFIDIRLSIEKFVNKSTEIKKKLTPRKHHEIFNFFIDKKLGFMDEHCLVSLKYF